MKKLFMILPLALILCLTFGCQDKEAMAEVEEQNIAIVKRVYDEMNKGNMEIWKEVGAPEFAYYNPSRSTNPDSREELAEGLQNIYNALPDLTFSIEDIITVSFQPNLNHS